jgi:hypothetical protein
MHIQSSGVSTASQTKPVSLTHRSLLISVVATGEFKLFLWAHNQTVSNLLRPTGQTDMSYVVSVICYFSSSYVVLFWLEIYITYLLTYLLTYLHGLQVLSTAVKLMQGFK